MLIDSGLLHGECWLQSKLSELIQTIIHAIRLLRKRDSRAAKRLPLEQLLDSFSSKEQTEFPRWLYGGFQGK